MAPPEMADAENTLRVAGSRRSYGSHGSHDATTAVADPKPTTTRPSPRAHHRSRAGNGFLLQDPAEPSQAARRRIAGRAAAPFRRPASKASRDGQRSTDSRSDDSFHTAVTVEYPTASLPLDPDSAEIVNMALNLGESRRRASQRRDITTSYAPLSQTMPPVSVMPPRLVSLPDTSLGSALRQHLQQQRVSSLTASLNSDRWPASRASSPLQAPFDLMGSGPGIGPTQSYPFSPSTLVRAQRAKDHMELLALYWQLLQVVPPIRPTNGVGEGVALGRGYNPLQFLRNRKVRARERRAIDGDAQGFGDAAAVASWVEQVQAQAHVRPMDPDALPPFSVDRPPGPSSAPRPRRTRADWSVNPADLLADAYWLAQGDNKLLIEDRNLNKIFSPAHGDLHHRQPQPSRHHSPRPSSSATAHEDHGFNLSKSDMDHSHNSARERARQKLHEIKDGFHHRHAQLHSHHDFLRGLGGHESSDDGGGDHEPARRPRANTLTRSTQDVLRKQMDRMVEEEEREACPPDKRLLDIYEDEEPRDLMSRIGRRSRPASRPASRLRKGSFTSVSESDEAPRRPKRRSLDAPQPDDTPGGGGGVGKLSSPPSRPGSPIRRFRSAEDYHNSTDSPLEKRSSLEKLHPRKLVHRPTLSKDSLVVKNLFKGGARIDTVLRGAGSKISELLWRKENHDSHDIHMVESVSEDEDEHRRGPRLALEIAKPGDGPHHLGIPAGLSRPSSSHSTRDRDHNHPTHNHHKPPPPVDTSSLAPPPPPPRHAPDSDASSTSSIAPATPNPPERRLSSLAWLSASLDATHRTSLVQAHRSYRESPVSRHELARLRAQIIGAGVLAMRIAHRPIAAGDILPCHARARTLARAIDASQARWHLERDAFVESAVPKLHAQIDASRAHVTHLSARVHTAADDADDAGHDIAIAHRLHLKRAVDVIEKMLRKRRRRFRWLRRAMWLGVEWALVGFMWSVWFAVMLFRVVSAVFVGVFRGVRWLLWL